MTARNQEQRRDLDLEGVGILIALIVIGLVPLVGAIVERRPADPLTGLAGAVVVVAALVLALEIYGGVRRKRSEER
jgi:hypothetical protein